MSFSITTASQMPSQVIAPELLKADPAQKSAVPKTAEEPTVKSTEAGPSAELLNTALTKIAAGHGYDDRHSLKTISHLMRSLQKMFGDAPNVDRETGEKEMRHGGMHRISKDLRKLFHGLGMPSQLAKQFAHDMTGALQNPDTEQLSFSLTATRTVNLDIQQLQSGYQASGDGSEVPTATTNSLQLSAVQVRSLDISINLRTGEFSLTRTRTDTLSLSGSSAPAQPGSEVPPDAGTEVAPPPAGDAQTAETAAAEVDPQAAAAEDTSVASPAVTTTDATTAQPTAPTNDIATQIQSNSFLLQISRTIQQSAVMQLKPVADTTDKAEEAAAEEPTGGLRVLQDMLARIEELTGQAQDLFESLVQVNNLRVEKEDGDDHLRFTMDALAPIGLTAVDQNGRGTTLYARPDGSLGKVLQNPVKVIA